MRYEAEMIQPLISFLFDEFCVDAIEEKLSKHLEDGIFELRSYLSDKIARTLYFYQKGSKIIITHGFVKKKQKTPRSEIKKSKELRDLYNKRLEK